jgi:hypothetical protein
MKKTIFVFKLIILLLSSISVSAQYDSFPAPPGYVDHQFPTYPSDSFYITKHGSTNPIDTSRISPEVFCPTPLAKDAASIVHYTNGIVAYVELDTFISGLSYYKQANDGAFILLSLSTKGVILRNLSANTKYTLSVINSCSDTVIMSIFKTDRDPANAKSLEINRKLYKYLSTWQTREDTANLYSYLQSIPYLHNIEKISLLQRWFMADTILTLVPGTYNSGNNFRLPPKSIFHKRGSCNCKFLIKTTKQHIGIISPADVKPWGSVWAHSFSESGSWGAGNSRADWYLGRNSKGPSKSHFLLGHGKGVERDKISLQGGPNIGTPYYAVREMSYTCANYDLYLDNCACDRTVNIKIYMKDELELRHKLLNADCVVKEKHLRKSRIGQ